MAKTTDDNDTGASGATHALVRVRKDILELAKQRAAEEHRSVTNYIAWLILEDARYLSDKQ